MGSRLAFAFSANSFFPTRSTPAAQHVTRQLLTMSAAPAPEVVCLDCTGTIMRIKGSMPRCVNQQSLITKNPAEVLVEEQQQSSCRTLEATVSRRGHKQGIPRTSTHLLSCAVNYCITRIILHWMRNCRLCNAVSGAW